MKKILLIATILFICGGCYQNYDNIPVEKPISGTAAVLDSAQWTPVLIHADNNDHKLYIHEKGEIRSIALIDQDDHITVILFLILACIFVVTLFIAATSR